MAFLIFSLRRWHDSEDMSTIMYVSKEETPSYSSFLAPLLHSLLSSLPSFLPSFLPCCLAAFLPSCHTVIVHSQLCQVKAAKVAREERLARWLREVGCPWGGKGLGQEGALCSRMECWHELRRDLVVGKAEIWENPYWGTPAWSCGARKAGCHGQVASGMESSSCLKCFCMEPQFEVRKKLSPQPLFSFSSAWNIKFLHFSQEPFSFSDLWIRDYINVETLYGSPVNVDMILKLCVWNGFCEAEWWKFDLLILNKEFKTHHNFLV